MTMELDEIKSHLQGRNDADLFARAEEVKQGIFGRDIFLRGIVEFSSICCKTCLYCGLRAANHDAVRYRLRPEQIVEAARLAPELGLGTVVLQSGDDYFFSTEDIRSIVEGIKKHTDLAVTLSVGDRPLDEFKSFRDIGADRYLLKLETTDPELYARIRPKERLEDRLARLDTLRSLGYEVGSGIIVGLPGMTMDILARDILTLARLDLDMLAAGPFVPHPQTPLKDAPPGDMQTTLRVTALLRILSPRSNIPATSALGVLPPSAGGKDGRALGLHAGCNVIMPSLTPESVRRAYEIYPGKNAFSDNARHSVKAVKNIIREEGFTPSPDKGFAPGPEVVGQLNYRCREGESLYKGFSPGESST